MNKYVVLPEQDMAKHLEQCVATHCLAGKSVGQIYQGPRNVSVSPGVRFLIDTDGLRSTASSLNEIR